MRRFIIAVASGVVLLASAAAAPAETIATATNGTFFNTGPFFVGESFTTTNPVTDTNITFNFYTNVPPTTPAAFGTGFLLNQQYLGTPAALGSGTTGFLGMASAVGGVYSFGSSVTLLPNTQYWFYENTSLSAGNFSGSSTYAGGALYLAATSGSNFADGFGSGTTANFLVTGTTAVPEPAAMVMGATSGLAGLGYWWYRRKRAA